MVYRHAHTHIHTHTHTHTHTASLHAYDYIMSLPKLSSHYIFDRVLFLKFETKTIYKISIKSSF